MSWSSTANAAPRKSRLAGFRLVGVLPEDSDACHLYLTNLPQTEGGAPDIVQLYRVPWEVELLIKELNSWFGIDDINTTDEYIIKALIIMAAIWLMISCVIVDELHKLNVNQRDGVDAVDESASRFTVVRVLTPWNDMITRFSCI